jgi:hypothetical protein
MVQDAKPVGLDGTQVCFDDERAVCDAGVMLVATLAGRLGTTLSCPIRLVLSTSSATGLR